MSKTLGYLEQIYGARAQVYRALNHPVRLAILDILRDGEQCVCHMEANLRLRQAYISQHLMVLREAGLVDDRKDGWNVFYHVTRPEIYQLTDAVMLVTRGPRPVAVAKRTVAVECPCPKCSDARAHAE